MSTTLRKVKESVVTLFHWKIRSYHLDADGVQQEIQETPKLPPNPLKLFRKITLKVWITYTIGCESARRTTMKLGADALHRCALRNGPLATSPRLVCGRVRLPLALDPDCQAGKVLQHVSHVAVAAEAMVIAAYNSCLAWV
jgi:hypothetical protein